METLRMSVPPNQPLNCDFYLKISNQLYEDGCNVLAIKYYTTAIELDSTNLSAYAKRAACYVRVHEVRRKRTVNSKKTWSNMLLFVFSYRKRLPIVIESWPRTPIISTHSIARHEYWNFDVMTMNIVRLCKRVLNFNQRIPFFSVNIIPVDTNRFRDINAVFVLILSIPNPNRSPISPHSPGMS